MAEKRELILDLLARDKSGGATASFGKKLKDVGDEADRAGSKAKGFGESSKRAAAGADELGDQAKQTARQLDGLNDEIASSNRQLGMLAAQFANTSDKAQRLDISKQIRQVENDIRRASKSKGILSALLPDPDPAVVGGFVKKLSGSITTGLSNAPMAAAGGIIAAAIAPTLLAGLAGAVTGGIGIGGIVGGFALAAKDPKIQATAKTIGSTFSKTIQAEAKDAFGGPVRESLRKLEDSAARTAPKIGKIFDNTAPSVDHLTDSLSGAVDALIDAAVVASGRSGPAIEGLGRLVEGTAGAVGDFIEGLSEYSEEGASAIDDLTLALTSMIKVASGIAQAGGAVKGWTDNLDDAIDKTRYWIEDNGTWLDLTADGYEKGSRAAELYRKGLIGVAGSANDYSAYLANASNATQTHTAALSNAQRAAQGHQDALAGLSNELRAQTDPVFGLLNAQDKLTEAQKRVKEATKDHGAKSKETKAALRDLAGAAIDMQGAAGKLGGTFNGRMTPALRATLSAAGATEPQIRALERQFASARSTGTKFAKTYKARAAVEGHAAARRALLMVMAATQSIPRVVTIAMRITGTTSVSKAAHAVQKQYARARGGPVTQGTPYWVGEEGPELVLPQQNGYVLNALQSKTAARSVGATVPAGAASGGMGGRVVLEVVGPEEMRTMLRKMIRSMNLLQG